MTVSKLLAFCKQQVAQGNGDKKIVVADDNEGNGYHGLFYAFTTIDDDDREYYENSIYDSRETNIDNIIVLG